MEAITTRVLDVESVYEELRHDPSAASRHFGSLRTRPLDPETLRRVSERRRFTIIAQAEAWTDS
jgi:hypothetical protein